MRIVIFAKCRNSDQLEHFFDTLFNLLFAFVVLVVIPQGLGNLRADLDNRIQGRHRVLKNHGDFFTAVHTAHLRLVHLEQVHSLDLDAAAGNLADFGRQKAQNGKCGRCFSGARLSDKADGFAFIEFKADAVDSVHSLKVGLVKNAQVLDLQHWITHDFPFLSPALILQPRIKRIAQAVA